MKYAIVECGGKQMKVVADSEIVIDYLHEDAGTKICFDQVLMVVDGETVNIGTPYIQGVKVNAAVLREEKGPKIIVFKYRPKKHYRVKTGHRQIYTRIKIEAIVEE